MHSKCVANYRFLFTAFVFAVLLFGFNENLLAQKVRLRSQIAPNCASGTSNWKFSDIFADGNIAVQGSYNCKGAFIYDISNPDAPVLANWYNPGNNQQFLEAIVVGNRGYFGSGTGNGGVHIVDLTNPYNPVLLGVVDPTHGNGHVKIHEMMVINQNGATYLIENYNQLSSSQKIIKVINVSDPANPVWKYDLNPTDTTWVHAFHIRGNRMYTSGWGGKVEIYDISNLATQAPTLLGAIQGNSTNHSTWTSEDGNYLYSCRETLDGDVRVYDVRNPAQPLLIKSIKANDLGINAITPHNPVVMGNKLYVAWYQAGLQVFDLTNPADPKRIGQYDTFQPAFAPTDREKELLTSGEPLDMICGGENLQNVLPSSYDGDWAVYPFLGEDKILVGDLTSGLFTVDVRNSTNQLKNRISDFDGDGKTDYSVFTPATGQWLIEGSSNNSQTTVSFGLAEDKLVTGDYDGDGKSDQAIFRPSTGTWWIRRSSNPANFQAVQFGLSSDIPVAADYDADGKTDIAVFRPSNGVWYVQQSTLGLKIIQWGTNGDVPITGDFEGDGKADLAVFRPSSSVWYVLKSSSSEWYATQFGLQNDKPLAGDFDGDGRNDISVYRPSTGVWYFIKSSDNSFNGVQFGIAEDLPVPGDYDGDGKADVAVYRPSTNVWYRLDSLNNAFSSRVFGASGDVPSPRSVQP